jgi:hypothetical protein
MTSDHYPRVIQEWCAATGMQTWAERDDMHVEIDDTLVGLIHGGESEPDDLYIYIDLGHLELPELYRSLLEQNVQIEPANHGCFAIHPVTNSIVYRTSLHLTADTNGASLPQELNQLIHTVRSRLETALAN